MALFTHTSLEIVLLLCFAFNLNICRVNKNIVNDPAVVWLLQPSASVETVSSDESSTSSSETEADDRIDRPIGPHRFNNRLPVPHHRPYKPSVSDQRNVPTKPKWKNPADGGQHGATGDLSKKPPNNEIHIEVDNLDQIGDFLKNLLNSDDVDVEINSAPGNIDDRILKKVGCGSLAVLGSKFQARSFIYLQALLVLTHR